MLSIRNDCVYNKNAESYFWAFIWTLYKYYLETLDIILFII